jgi:hypothetical protein
MTDLFLLSFVRVVVTLAGSIVYFYRLIGVFVDQYMRFIDFSLLSIMNSIYLQLI